MRLRYRRGGQAVIVLPEGCKCGEEDIIPVGVVEYLRVASSSSYLEVYLRYGSR